MTEKTVSSSQQSSANDQPLSDKDQQVTKTASSGKRKKWLIGLAIFFILLGISYAVYHKVMFSHQEETDNAYVGGNLVTLTPQVSGIIIKIMADETQLVTAGEPLIQFDPSDAALSLKKAEAELGEAVRTVRQKFANVGEFNAMVSQRRVELTRVQDDYARRLPLLKAKAVSVEDVEHAKQAILNAKQALNVTEEQLKASRSAVSDVTIAQHPSVLKARANFEQAYLAAQRNTLLAPVTGYVAKRSAQLGQRVNSGTPLMAIIPLDSLWVDANFKEPELRDIRIGQPAAIETDLYGSKVVYHGKVVGLAAGTGAAFSLLPAQNATGNWIKVVQRVPVRIALDPSELKKNPLRVGLSAAVTVDTHELNGTMLSQASARIAQPVYATQVYETSWKEAESSADRIIERNAGAAIKSVHAASVKSSINTTKIKQRS